MSRGILPDGSGQILATAGSIGSTIEIAMHVLPIWLRSAFSIQPGWLLMANINVKFRERAVEAACHANARLVSNMCLCASERHQLRAHVL